MDVLPQMGGRRVPLEGESRGPRVQSASDIKRHRGKIRLNCRTGTTPLGLPHKIPAASVDANPAAASSSAPDELTSWKEIAVYLAREVRTVQRWEKTDGLPIRRLKHAKRGSVFAYRQELDRWLQSRSQAPTDETVNADKAQPRDLGRWAAIAVVGGLATVMFVSALARFSHRSGSAARSPAAVPGQAAYLRGIYYFHRGRIEDLRESEQYFKQALAANGKYADAQARL